jgi:asparagine synthase (glutamine-hydrolysing)
VVRVTSDRLLLPDILAGKEEVLQMVNDLYNKAKGRDELTRILYVDVKMYMIENCLVKSDRMSMANSIELRAPLLDSKIVEFAFSLPTQMKIRGSRCKYILKNLAMKYVCPQILDIPKTGFSIPAENYLRSVWRSDFENRVFHADSPLAEFINISQLKTVWGEFLKGNNIMSHFFWTTYILSLWFSEFHQRQGFNSANAICLE